MTAAQVSLVFEQGVQRDVVVSNWSDDDGNAYDLTGYTAELMIRARLSDVTPLFTKTSATGGTIMVALVDGVWTVTAPFTESETASMVPITAIRPLCTFPSQTPAFPCGYWELRLISNGGYVYSVMRGQVFIILAVVK